MSSFLNQNVRMVRNISRSSSPEIPIQGNIPENMRGEHNDRSDEHDRIERIRQRMLEYRTILQCLRSLRTAENMRYRTKHRAMKEKCERYKQEVVEERRLNANFQESFAHLEQQLINSTQRLFHLQTENERERRNMGHLEENFEQTIEILTQVRKKNATKNRLLNRTTKNALHAKRIAERKLREALEKYEAEVKHVNELEDVTKTLQSTVQQLKLELEQKERLCNDSKKRLAIHSEAASLAYRQIHEANKKTAELVNENEKLHSQFTNTHTQLIDSRQAHCKMEMEMNRIKLENAKHCDELQKMKQIIEVEMASLIQIVEQNRILLIQKGNAINLLTNENLEIKKRTQQLEEVKKNMEEAIRSSEAVLQAQHQELQVYEANQKIREREINMLKVRQHGLATNRTVMLEQEAEQFQQVVHHSVCRVIGFRNQIACMLENADKFLRIMFQENATFLQVDGLNVQANYVPTHDQVIEQNPMNQNMLGGRMQKNYVFPSAPSHRVMNDDVELPGPSNRYHHGQQNIPLHGDDINEIKIKIC
ncbi:hypothetical protein LOAG_09438 [Loa loa]|uniref:Uncharacterized protein n=1 Tax=Loa loa TaxID=7209 RepID=A0A1I7VJT8_LOALO|nr:hypothetical protein LOAG_09438 [Loa loa]EFO19059.2 hypothetical protein LOAG_09438 [Loa loa]